MKVEILATGDEIRSGALVDSNSAFISQILEENGFSVVRHQSVGDQLEQLSDVLNEMKERSDIVIVTGGLGPTSDDITALAAARAKGVSLVMDEMALKDVETFFLNRKIKMPESNKKQAMLPEGATFLSNPIGTAPGFYMKLNQCTLFFLPGVPAEMKLMMKDQIISILHRLFKKGKKVIVTRTISLFGLPESTVGDKMEGIQGKFPEIQIGFRAKFPEIQVKLYIKGEDEKRVREVEKAASKWVVSEFGDNVVSDRGESIEAVIGELLKSKNATVAFAESCTGGLIAHNMTNVSGSSGYFLFSGVTYCNNAKIKVLNVSAETISKYGAVSEQTVKEMARGAKEVSGATYAVSTSGVAGPTGGTKEKPVGTVCVGIASPSGVDARKFTFTFSDRLMNKKIFAYAALNLLRRHLTE